MRWLLALCVLSCAGSGTLVRPSPRRAEAPSCVSRVKVFDGRGEVLSGPWDVSLAAGRIASMRVAQGSVAPGCRDGAGRTLLPGLIDSHVHLGLVEGMPPWALRLPDEQRELEMLLYSGVTTVLVPEGGDGVAALAHQVSRGERFGPTLLFASRIFTAEGGHPTGMYRAGPPWPVSSLIIAARLSQLGPSSDLTAAVAAELPRGPQFLKVVYDALPAGTPHLTSRQLEGLIAAGRAAGVPVVVHVGGAREAVEAARAGAAVLMHVPWEDPLSAEDVAAIAATQVPVVSTSRIYAAIDAAGHERLALRPLEREVCPPGCEAAFAHRPKDYVLQGFGPEFEAALPGWDRTLGANLRALVAGGVPILAGTDSGLPGVFLGAALHRELQNLVALGLSPAAALRSATSIPAGVLDPSRRFGVVEPGAVADLLLVEGDPLADITATEHVVAVWKGGREVIRVPAH